jgi:two-component system, NtrC family, response regulator GlrR
VAPSVVDRRRRGLLIEQVSLPIAEPLASVGVSWEHVPWGTGLIPERLRDASLEFVVAVASPARATATMLLEWLGAHRATAPTIAILDADAGDDVVQLAADVVDDFLFWPAHPAELRQRLARMLAPDNDGTLDDLRTRLVGELGLANLVGHAPAFVETLERIPVVARHDGSVLITGETGTGKELFARAVHHLSRRRDYAFVPVDCAASPEHLLENELFGHERGAYTDARSRQKGLLGIADGGTIFLDEIDALSLAAQAKLLRVLQERTYKPLGSDQFVTANVRVIAASNRNLERCVAERTFRADLYYRLDVFHLPMPPLRDRMADIPLLARHFLDRFCAEAGLERKTFTAAALARLSRHAWPGNVRELLNVVQRAAAFAGPQILPSDLPLPALSEEDAPAPLFESFRAARARALSAFEHDYVERLMRKHEGNVTRAAREAQQDRRAFGRLVKRLGIPRPQHPPL